MTETNQTLPIDQSIIDTIFANLRPCKGCKLIVEPRIAYWAMVDDGSGIDPTETEIALNPERFDDRYWWAAENELEAMRKFARRMNGEVTT